MYEDSWYSYMPEVNTKPASATSQSQGHRRTQSLLQQPNGHAPVIENPSPLKDVYEKVENPNTPPEPELIRRAASYSDFYRVVRAQIAKDDVGKRRRRKAAREERRLDALLLGDPVAQTADDDGLESPDSLDHEILEASQKEYLLYSDQLVLTERHLDGLVADADAALKLLTSVSDSFQSVEAQTSTFRSQCEDLLDEQHRLEKLAHDVGTDIHYYEYLETATRRLNAPGAGKMVDHEDFGEMMEDIDACIAFMTSHENYRDRDSYLARYNTLLTKALHLLDHGLSSKLDRISADIGRQLASAKSESARHALAYGRFEELILETYSLLPNVQKVIRTAYDQYGRKADSTADISTYVISAGNMFQTYLTIRDRDLKQLTQQDMAEYKKEVQSLSVETASRNLIKQTFERLSNEEGLFHQVFGIEPVWITAQDSAFQVIKGIATTMVHPGNIVPLATSLQSVLSTSPLKMTCSIVGWLASEYAVPDQDDEESPFQRKCREYAARLLVDHLWAYTDAAFEAEINKTISRATVHDNTLKIEPVVGGVASSNAHPLVKSAIELLAIFDQAMPKERSSKDSSVVFKIVREIISVLQRAETRIKAITTDTDPDLFMVKNLLIIKNELVSLEIGDIRSQTASMQHFGQIWDTLSPQNWVGFFSSVMGGSLWSRGDASAVTAKTLTIEDMSEQLDELLRQSIYSFTRRWGQRTNDSASRKVGSKPIAKLEAELEGVLQTAFSNQPEVIARLKEAIEQNSQAQNEAKEQKKGARRY